MVGAMLGHGCWNVGSWLVQCWVMVGTKLGDGWWNVGSWLVQCWVMVGSRLGHGWYNVGSWLVQCWFMVGRMLHYGWRFILGQRVSNEQSNVRPTKYVAVGPTLNQRLGFGWRMVIVLAGRRARGDMIDRSTYLLHNKYCSLTLKLCQEGSKRNMRTQCFTVRT